MMKSPCIALPPPPLPPSSSPLSSPQPHRDLSTNTIAAAFAAVVDADAAFHCRHHGNPHRLSHASPFRTRMARDMLAGNPTCADLTHQHTLLSSHGCQATRAAEDVLAARASAHTHELNELRASLQQARDDATRCARVYQPQTRTPQDTSACVHKQASAPHRTTHALGNQLTRAPIPG